MPTSSACSGERGRVHVREEEKSELKTTPSIPGLLCPYTLKNA